MQTTLESRAAIEPANGQAKPVLDGTIQKFVDVLATAGGQPIYTLSPDDARNLLTGAQSGPILKLEADIEDRVIPVGPKCATRIRIIRPKGNSQTLPVVMYFHGGGWILGDKNTHDRLVREIAIGTQATVVFVDYVRSPESQYPAATEENYAATKYVAEHAEEFNVDASRLAIAGDSVGGNMVAVVALIAKRLNGPRIRAQVLLYPVTDANFDTGSYKDFQNGPWLTKAAMKWFWDAYLPEVSKRKHPTVSPLQTPVDDLRGLPPALIITNENDVLRDEAEAYARKLMQAGVAVTAVRYLGVIHDMMLLNGIADAPPVRAAMAQANDFLRTALIKS